MAERQTGPEEGSTLTPDQVRQQAERRREVFAQLEDEFIINPGTRARQVREIDALIQEAESLGGLHRPDGDREATDANFEGGRLVGANPEWQTVLEAMRAAKEAQIAGDLPHVQTEFQLDLTSDEAQRQPLLYLQEHARQLVEAGYAKFETGRGVQPDGMFFGNRLVATSPALAAEIADLHTAGGNLLRDRLDQHVADATARAATLDDTGRLLATEVQDLAARGLLELDEVSKGGAIEMRAVADPRARKISEVYRNLLDSKLAAFPAGSDERKGFDKHLASLRKQLKTIKVQGDRNRGDLLSGRDAERARKARERIDQLNAEDEREDVWSTYAPNLAATQVRDDYENAMRREDDRIRLGLDPMATEQDIRDAAMAEAVRNDPDYRAQVALEDEHNARIAQVEATIRRTPDERMKLEMRKQITALEKQRASAMLELKQRQDRVRTEGAGFAAEALVASAERRSTYDTVAADDENFDAVARARRSAMGINAVPFREQRRGNVVEAYFMAPGNNNLVVMERYDRQTGALLSQSTWTTEDTLVTDRRGRIVPPNEVLNQITQTRPRDEGLRAGRARGRRVYGGVGAMDGVYASYGATPAQRGRLQGPGGIVRYFLGGGNRHTT